MRSLIIVLILALIIPGIAAGSGMMGDGGCDMTNVSGLATSATNATNVQENTSAVNQAPSGEGMTDGTCTGKMDGTGPRSKEPGGCPMMSSVSSGIAGSGNSGIVGGLSAAAGSVESGVLAGGIIPVLVVVGLIVWIVAGIFVVIYFRKNLLKP